jgi:hypothetical protein
MLSKCRSYSCFIFELWLRIVFGMKKVTKLFVFSALGSVFGIYWLVYVFKANPMNPQGELVA